MNAVELIIPFFLIALLIFCFIKKVKIYDVFTEGAKQSVPLVISLFPYIIAIFLMIELFNASELSQILINLLSPVFKVFGIPEELVELILLKPFSGSGSFSLLSEIYNKYGTDGYIGILASALFGSSETVFYIAAVYYCKCKNKRPLKAIIISLIATFISSVFCSFICKFFF